MIDWGRIAELAEEVGQEDFEEVVELFLEEVEERIATLSQIETSSDLEETLHFLKGSALNLGFEEFSKHCQVGETSAAADQTDTIDRQSIVDCYQRSKQAFLLELKSHNAA